MHDGRLVSMSSHTSNYDAGNEQEVNFDGSTMQMDNWWQMQHTPRRKLWIARGRKRWTNVLPCPQRYVANGTTEGEGKVNMLRTRNESLLLMKCCHFPHMAGKKQRYSLIVYIYSKFCGLTLQSNLLNTCADEEEWLATWRMHWDSLEWYRLKNFFFPPLKWRNAVSLQDRILREQSLMQKKTMETIKENINQSGETVYTSRSQLQKFKMHMPLSRMISIWIKVLTLLWSSLQIKLGVAQGRSIPIGKMTGWEHIMCWDA